MGTFGFSYIGLIFLCCLFIPNILFTLYPPKDKLVIQENNLLLVFERLGQALCTILVLIFDDFNFHGINRRTIWLIGFFLLIFLYLICWIRYFRGSHETKDFLKPFLGIPLPLAVLPVAAVFLLSVYGKIIWLGIASVVLGIGHIGIAAQNWAVYKKLHIKEN